MVMKHCSMESYTSWMGKLANANLQTRPNQDTDITTQDCGECWV